MILLLDTYALICALEGSPRLSSTARDAIEDTRNTVLASGVSAWEIAIKRSLGQLATPEDLEATLVAAGFSKRLVTFADVRRLETLPAHHHDPFDPMLVAQAIEEGASLVSGDPKVARYPVHVRW